MRRRRSASESSSDRSRSTSTRSPVRLSTSPRYFRESVMVTLDPLAVRVARRFLGAIVFRRVPAERVNVASMDSGRLMSSAEVTVDDQGRGAGVAEDPTAGRVAVQYRRDTVGLV